MEENNTVEPVVDALVQPADDNASMETEVTQDQAEPQAGKVEDEAPFPKKAVNAISRRDKQIGRLRAEKAAYEAELAKYREQLQSKEQPKNDGPSEDQFDNYGDYLKAVARHEAKQELAQGQKQQQEQQLSIQEQRWVAQREDYIADQAQKAIDSIPDFKDVLSENVDIVDSFPPAIQRVFLEAENAPMAFYALAKEGRLEDLLSMSPYQAAMAIGAAQNRGEALTKKPITSAPTPIQANRGAAPVGTRPENMSGDELLKAIRRS